MNRTELSDVLDSHAAWLRRPDSGSRADLRDADLRDAVINGAIMPAKLEYRTVWAGGPRSRLAQIWRWDGGPLHVTMGCIVLVDPSPAEWAQAFADARGDDWTPTHMPEAAADAVGHAIRAMTSAD